MHGDIGQVRSKYMIHQGVGTFRSRGFEVFETGPAWVTKFGENSCRASAPPESRGTPLVVSNEPQARTSSRLITADPLQTSRLGLTSHRVLPIAGLPIQKPGEK